MTAAMAKKAAKYSAFCDHARARMRAKAGRYLSRYLNRADQEFLLSQVLACRKLSSIRLTRTIPPVHQLSTAHSSGLMWNPTSPAMLSPPASAWMFASARRYRTLRIARSSTHQGGRSDSMTLAIGVAVYKLVIAAFKVAPFSQSLIEPCKVTIARCLGTRTERCKQRASRQ